MIIGKTRMPEFGQWPFTESVDGGYTRNPWDRGHTPGGSSGGTAVAVAAGMVPVGIGGDGGGSIRIPSACCGLFGLKPQRGRVTTAPMEHLWWALGTAGPLTRSVLDSALVYDVIRGNDGRRPVPARRSPRPRFIEAARCRTGPAADRLVDQAGDQGAASRPGPRAGGARDGPAAHRPRPRGRRGRPALPRRRRWRSCRSSSPASAPRATRWSTTTGWRSAPGRPTGSAAGCVPGSSQGRCGRGEGRREGQPGLRRPRRRRRAAHPDDRAPAAPGRACWTRAAPSRAALSVAADDRLRALWNVDRQPGRLGAGRASPRTGCRWRCSWSAGCNDETTLLTLSAQLEAARPWSMPVLGPAAGDPA